MDRRALPVLLVLVVAIVGTVVAAVSGGDDEVAAGQATTAQPAASPAPAAATSEGAAGSSASAATPESGAEPSGIVEVVIEQTNNPIFDLMPVELNGVSLVGQFDGTNENNLDEPLTIPAGEIRFVLRNVGTLAHNFQVRLLDGTNLKKTKNVGPRKTGELLITLEPGNYLIACPISDHDQRGMLRPLVVTAAGN